MSKYVILVSTTNKKEEAEKIVNECLKNKLAACAQIFEIKSNYWWQGEIENSVEYRFEFKTTKKKSKELIKFIKSIHSYQVPEVITIPIINGEKNYLNWIENSLK
ncbi:MAG: divalent-cation tolerance protein CutA [Brevinematales bacterium]|nr:divalent-cation tolerance protein CutA [Brevinematales bacterium]